MARKMKPRYRMIPAEWVEAFSKSLDKHIEAVREAGSKLGVPEMLLIHHDESKWSEAEFPHYARQFHGDKADPDGFAGAWLHHLHQNPHHWQHWVFPDGYVLKGSSLENGVMPMPDKYALEMVADWIGASVTYTGSEDILEWLIKNAPKIRLHTRTEGFVKEVLLSLGYNKNIILFQTEFEEWQRQRIGG